MAHSHAHPSPALSDWTASTASPMLNEKSRFQGNAVYMPVNNTDAYAYTATSPRHVHHHRLKKITRWNNMVAYVASIFSVGLTAVMDGIMVYVLYKFYTTKDIPAPNRVSPWAKGTQLWPAFMLLIASFVTLCCDVVALIAACCARGKEGTAERVESLFVKTGYVIFVVKWIVVFILYRIGRTSKDLWGWSCDQRAKNIQQFYILYLDFSKLCLEQTIAWYLSIAEMALKVILMVITFWVAREIKKMRHRA